MNSQLEKAIKLAKKTGDKIIIFDSIDSLSATVIMSLDEYEKLSENKAEVKNLTEEELLDKINRDIAIWKNEQEKGKNIENFSFSNEKSLSQDKNKEENKITKNNFKKGWGIPKGVKEGAEEIIEDSGPRLEEI